MLIVNISVNNDEQSIVTEAKHSRLPPVVNRRHSVVRLTLSRQQQQQQQQQNPAG